jgi:hypothetical protein
MSVIAARPSKTTLHCPNDNWDFDPRYTEGVCPICGWGPGRRPQPAWVVRVETLPWDYIALGVFALLLLVVGVLVGTSANINILPQGS